MLRVEVNVLMLAGVLYVTPTACSWRSNNDVIHIPTYLPRQVEALVRLRHFTETTHHSRPSMQLVLTLAIANIARLLRVLASRPARLRY
jgi:hypothetical protein